MALSGIPAWGVASNFLVGSMVALRASVGTVARALGLLAAAVMLAALNGGVLTRDAPAASQPRRLLMNVFFVLHAPASVTSVLCDVRSAVNHALARSVGLI